ncbi:Aste57867_17198 [Aphanomyces stellatus]|uniref:Aste57867_17198 protein n=1 Tax=Aphanomyces stellatus TaxID=120398 RepID=A0A485L780_9STRA|nr:hypothetical protein As57867_017139 [Aphanomyces stellatus]VFT93955.1 Aste57867_17198 [Aphanomyces stellatus]
MKHTIAFLLSPDTDSCNNAVHPAPSILASPRSPSTRLLTKDMRRCRLRRHLPLSPSSARSTSTSSTLAAASSSLRDTQHDFLHLVRWLHATHRPYKDLQGTYIVPMDAPPSLRGRTFDVKRIRQAYRHRISKSSKASWLDPAVIAELSALGFAWDVAAFQWTQTIRALAHYKTMYGDVVVPQAFRVDAADAAWPDDLRGRHVGWMVHNLRAPAKVRTMPPWKRAELDALGFVWGGLKPTIEWTDKVAALRHFRRVFGHIRVPQSFVVPSHAPWDERVWGMRLGRVVNKLRQGARRPRERATLDALGFVWKTTAAKTNERPSDDGC